MDVEAIDKMINKKTSEIFSHNQNHDVPMDWQTAKHRAALELINYVSLKFMDVPEPDYGEYADLRQREDEIPEQLDDFNFGEGDFANVDPGEEIPFENESEKEDTDQYSEMKLSDFLKAFDFYNYKEKEPEHSNQEQPKNEQI